MKVLVYECAPKALKQFLTKQGHRCLTVQEARDGQERKMGSFYRLQN